MPNKPEWTIGLDASRRFSDALEQLEKTLLTTKSVLGDATATVKALEEGASEERAALEEEGAAGIAAALAAQLAAVEAQAVTSEEAAKRILAHTEVLRQAGQTTLSEAALLGVQAARADLGAVIGVEWDGVNEAALAWARAYSYDLVRGLNETSLALLQKEIGDWIERGGTLEELRARLTPHFGEERARTIAATEVTRAYAEGNVTAWQASGVVSGKEWRTAKDDRVCPICGPLHGALVALEGEFEGGWRVPPAHVRCRCWLVPVMRK